MASIENRSQFVVTVQNREDLSKTFACTREQQLKSYLTELKAANLKFVHFREVFEDLTQRPYPPAFYWMARSVSSRDVPIASSRTCQP